MKKRFTLIIACLAILPAKIFSQEWTPTNATPTQNMFRGGKVGIGSYYLPDNAASAWYGSNPGPALDLWAQNPLGTSAGNFAFIKSISGNANSSWIRQSDWLFRTTNGGGWSTASLHNGLSVDASYQTPGSDTKTWWERNPSADLQKWGNNNSTYMRLAHGKLGLGTDIYYNPDDAGTWYNSVPGNYFSAPQLEVWSQSYCGTNLNDAAMISSFSSKAGTNWVHHNNYIRRKTVTSSNGWDGIAMHDGISIDASYLYPGITTRTYWERDPYNDIQSWGTGQSAYMRLDRGRLRIGTKSPDMTGVHNDAQLSVYGKVIATSFYVTTASGVWADYVFEKNYKLMSIKETEAFVKEFKHLPGVPSAKEVEANGINLAQTNIQLLEKLEEAYLHIMELNKRVEELEQKINKN